MNNIRGYKQATKVRLKGYLFRVIGQTIAKTKHSNVGLKRITKTVLAVFVAVAITGSLVMPAATITKQAASRQGGVDIAKSADESDATTASASSGEDASGSSEKSSDVNSVKSDASAASGKDKDSAENAQKADNAKKADNADKADNTKKTDNAEKNDSQVTEKSDSQSIQSNSKSELIKSKQVLTVKGKSAQNTSEKVEISATLGKDTKLPADTELEVTEIVEKSAAKETNKSSNKGRSSSDRGLGSAATVDGLGYTEYLDAALKAIGKEGKNTENIKADQVQFARFYDISLISDGEEQEPAAPVKVNIAYSKAIEVEDTDKVEIVHFSMNKRPEKSKQNFSKTMT